MSEREWTQDESGRSNSSVEFVAACDVVERCIRSSASQLINGSVEQVARSIVARLAHEHGFAPQPPEPPQEGE